MLTAKRDAILDATAWVQELEPVQMKFKQKSEELTSALPNTSTPKALLRELILTNGVFPAAPFSLCSAKLVQNSPINPVTPLTISSLLSWIGLGSKREISSFSRLSR